MPQISCIRGSFEVTMLDKVCIRKRAIVKAIRDVGYCYKSDEKDLTFRVLGIRIRCILMHYCSDVRFTFT